MSLNHQKVSAVPDGSNAALVQPSDWNAAHVFSPALTGILADPAGTNAFTGIAASAPGQYLRRKRNVASVTYEFAEMRTLVTTDYDFSIAPASNLTAGVLATVTLSPFPSGINSESPNKHYLRIVDGVGGNETVLITAVPSATTVQFLPASNHTAGNYTITSATSGIQEAFYSDAPVSLIVPDGVHYGYAPLFLRGVGGNCTVLSGFGPIASRYIRHSSFPAGDLVKWEGNVTAGYLIVRDLKFQGTDRTFNNTSGAVWNLTTAAPEHILFENVEIIDGYQLVKYTGLGIFQVNDCRFRINTGYAYAYADLFYCDGSSLIMTKTWITDSTASFTYQQAAMRVRRSDGSKIFNSFFSGYDGIVINNDASEIFNFFYIDDCIIDSCSRYGIFVSSGSHNSVFEHLRISGCHISQNSPYAMEPDAIGIYIANDIRCLQILNCNIRIWQYSGIVLGTAGVMPREVTISGCSISNNNARSTTGYGLVCNYANYYCGINIVGNHFTNIGSIFSTVQNVGLYFAGVGQFYGYNVTGNNFLTNNVYPTYADPGATFINFVMGNNNGVDDNIISVDSAATINTPSLPRTIYLALNNNVTTITPVWSGRRLTLHRVAAGSITIGGGGNCVGAAVTLSQFGTVELTYNGPHGAWMVK